MIFSAEDAYVLIPAWQQLRTQEQTLRIAIGEFENAPMQIDPAIARLLACNDLERRRVLVSPDEKIYIARRPQSEFGVEAGDGPSLDENRLDTCAPEQAKNLLNFGFVSLGQEYLQAKRLVHQLRGGRVAQLSGSNAPPSQSS